ncbi:MAG: VIT1/CCC1 transporter family protein [Candidatus Omnitrophica bacterium]|nr:VIT1/CCC1 transporter family protein [Candidatus Omnitrophota bacterium]
MPSASPPHTEEHFTASRMVRDAVLGMADGLTVPFALAAGLSGAVNQNWIVVTAGLAEVVAGAISMGLGGYLAAQSEAEHYANERRREEQEIVEKSDIEKEEVVAIFRSYGLTAEEAAPVVSALAQRPKDWVDFMMRFELGLEQPERHRTLVSAATIGGAYAVGGLIPLWPYMAFASTHAALGWSATVTVAALLLFGYAKGRFTGVRPLKSAAQMTVVGSVAAAAAFLIAKAIS